jgi:hypothetical protein
MPISRCLRLYRWPQHVAPHLGYGRLLGWCLAVGLSVHAPDQQHAITKVRCLTLEPPVESQVPDDGHNYARNMLSES